MGARRYTQPKEQRVALMSGLCEAATREQERKEEVSYDKPLHRQSERHEAKVNMEGCVL